MESQGIQQTIMSIYIPRVNKNISKNLIVDIFEDLKYGKVKKVDLIEKMDKKGIIYYSAFIHLDYWYDNIASQNFQERIRNPNKEARIVYKEPMYWLCLENKSAVIIPDNKKKYNQPKTRIDLSELTEFNNKIQTEKLPQETIVKKLDINDLFITASQKNSIKNEENMKKSREMDILEYVKYLETMNYKLMYDLRNIQGDFIITN
jgi:hypothetical protein